MDYLTMLSAVPQNRTALIENDNCRTYGDLSKAALEIRREFNRTPAKPGDLSPVWIRETSAYLQLVHFLAHSGTSHVPVILPQDTRTSCNTNPFNEKIPTGACMGVMTSGTTGTPKIWFRTFESWHSFFPIQNRIFGINSSTRIAVHGSLAFTGNLNMYLSILSEGAAIITCTPVHPYTWSRSMLRHQANAVYMIPSKLRLLAGTGTVPDFQIKTIISGSQSLGLNDIRTLKAAYPKSHCTLYYGASELSFVSYIRDSQMNHNPACVGIPFPGINISIRNREITVHTPYRVLEVPNPYSAGDLGYIGPDGFLYLLGRKDKVYNIHGRKISAVRIEQALLALDQVKAAAVVPEQDSLTAYIVPIQDTASLIGGDPPDPSFFSKEKKQAFTQMLMRKLKDSLESYELPRRMIYVKELPL